MLTLYHSPNSRSTTIIAAIDEMGIADKITVQLTPILRYDGSGRIDPQNPHPDGKVPALVHENAVITERPAILTYLSDLFPDAPGVRAAGHPERGPFLTWLAYYGDVVEPVLICAAAELSHPYLTAGFRGLGEMHTRLCATFADGRDFLMPGGFSTADLIMAAPFLWLPDQLPKDSGVRAWFDRVSSRPSVIAAAARDQQDMAILAA